ncbi:proline--tRNA ligase [Solwaraspora sp. WMMD791]|uniref:proline--tRNA ligase n=1 Tax=Solwaraspora sp. WMMD791 TaxID=3016086 RepID=UPI002499ADDE|nr:proline--tRNA ligase [Solwaraspora sp. WMMD791]WFE30168.1 proline--tRNA ligase [Solwaraspora sp. WMMD791]
MLNAWPDNRKVIMRWSQLHVPTLREDPAEADAPSHRLLLRAGYLRPLMAGHYSLLPLAVRVRAKVVAVIRDEMTAIGAQEFALPALHPAEIWRTSGRWDSMGEEMFRLRDRKGADLALGMTHEEVFTTLAQELNSYRQLPQRWYQFQTKFRDEPRPKAGLMRTREFTMKDSYSFDLTADGLDRSFDLHHAAYQRIFARLGIPAVAVQASSGAMGGSASVEFMCPAPTGEDRVVDCPGCGYAANLEKATSRVGPSADATESGDAAWARRAADAAGSDAPQPFDTPGVRTIDDLAVGFGAPADRQIKTLVYVVDGQLTLVLLRGDHPLNEQKLTDVTGAARLRAAHVDEIRAALGASPGSLGAVGVTAEVPVIADEALRGRRDMFTGANIDGVHLRGVDVDRDIRVGRWADLREVAAGQPCAGCGAPLRVRSAIEVGHIFKLGRRYSEVFDACVLDPAGHRSPVLMGCYGIGVERAMAAIVECHHDDKGIVWPVAVAPFEVAVVVAQVDDGPVADAGERIYQQLRAERIDVVVDDRAERAGVKFRDVELVGIPWRVTVGRRSLAEGVVEVTERATGETVRVPVDEVVGQVRDRLRSADRSDPVPVPTQWA